MTQPEENRTERILLHCDVDLNSINCSAQVHNCPLHLIGNNGMDSLSSWRVTVQVQLETKWQQQKKGNYLLDKCWSVVRLLLRGPWARHPLSSRSAALFALSLITLSPEIPACA